MSPLSTSQRVALLPGRAAMAGDRARPVEASSDDQGWQGALGALQTLLAGAGKKGGASVVISQRFARHHLLPAPAAWLSGNEMRLWLAERLDASLDGAGAWQIAWQADAPGWPVLACAVETALLDGLRRVFKEAGMKPASIRSWPTAAFNRHERVLRRATGWYAVIEPGVGCLMRLEQGRITALRQRNLGADAVAELSGLIGREAVLNGVEAGGELWLDSHGMHAAWAGLVLPGVKVHALPSSPSLQEAMVAP